MTAYPIDNSRFDRAALEAELVKAGGEVRGAVVKCPFHDDKHPSAGVYQGDDQVWRYKCQTVECGFSGDLYDVRARAEGKDLADILKAKSKTSGPFAFPGTKRKYDTVDDLVASVSNLVNTFTYRNPDTLNADMIVLRTQKPGEGKSFLQAHETTTGIVFGGAEKPWPIYNRARVRLANTVVVVEGEKCVHALDAVGITATTSPSGAGKAAEASWLDLQGKTVVLWPDNDVAGTSHMKAVMSILEKLPDPPRILMIDPDELGLPAKGDAADFIESGHDPHKAIADAKSVGPSTEVGNFIGEIIAGKRRNLPWTPTWRLLNQMAYALIPSTVTLVCGEPGSGKSFAMLQVARSWHDSGIPVAVYELEETREYHLRRCLAQLAGNSNMTDYDWIREHPDQANQHFETHRHQLDSFGATITCSSDGQPNLKDLSDWVVQQAEMGKRVILLDPITVADKGRDIAKEDATFVVTCKQVADKYGCSIVLVTHPAKVRGKRPEMNDLSGGASFERLAQCIIWLKRHDKRTEWVQDPNGYCKYQEINRTMAILKSRNGKGATADIGFWFDPGDLGFTEKGLIVKEADR